MAAALAIWLNKTGRINGTLAIETWAEEVRKVVKMHARAGAREGHFFAAVTAEYRCVAGCLNKCA